MRLKITHRTEYRYDEPVNYALQRLRLVPCSGATQKVRSWTLTIEGAREEVRFSDHFEQRHAADQCRGRSASWSAVEASGEVETYDKAGVTGFHRGFAPLWLFRRETPLTLPDEAASGACRGDRRGRRYRAPAPADGHHPRTRRLRRPPRRKPARPANDGARRSADGAGRPGDGASHGVRQDHAEIFIAAARLLGFPARYVSGYLMPDGVAADRRRAMPGPKRMSRAWAGSASTSPTTCRPTNAMCASQPAATIARRCLSREFGWDRPRNGLR